MRNEPLRTMNVSVVVPVFNSAPTIDDLVGDLVAVLTDCATRYEIILVDDGSSDGSWDSIATASRRAHVRPIRLRTNFGEQSALLCGISAARLDVVVTVDDDLQQPPTEIRTLIAALTDEVDVVYGAPTQYGFRPGRRAGTWAAKLALEHVMGVPRATKVTSSRAFRTHLRDSFPPNPGPLFSIDALLASTTTRIVTVPVRHDPRRTGSSGYTLPMLVTHSMNLVAGSSSSPLLFASAIGAVCVAVGALGLVLLVASSILRDAAFSWAWCAAAVGLGLAGGGFIALGILGDYAARILRQGSGAPPYLIDRSAGGEG